MIQIKMTPPELFAGSFKNRVIAISDYLKIAISDYFLSLTLSP